jgi:putative SOS response-associated peptidase YedK
MCGRFNTKDDSKIASLCEVLSVTSGVRLQSDLAPGGVINIIHQSEAVRAVSKALWWLLLDEDSLKPNYKYSSFNSRSDKLHNRQGISFLPYRESRCIIPATAFVEGLGDKKTYHMIELPGSAIAFGGLYKEYKSKKTGAVVYSASIITLPSVSVAWNKISPKSMPLILDFNDQALMEKWISPEFSEVGEFEELFSGYLPQDLTATPIAKPSRWDPIGESFHIRG